MSETLRSNSEEKEQGLSRESQQNIYCREKFIPEEAKQRVEALIADFKNYYSSLGYKEEPPVSISSGVDPTVRFIGSHISVLKPYLVENRVPSPGLFMRQDCIRTQNADRLLDDDYHPNWGSYFPSIGAITPPERLSESCNEAFDFFEKQLGISIENILVRINSSDADLLKACEQRSGLAIEKDSRKPEYYKHKIGIEGIKGRSFNIALRDHDGRGFSDVGNIIIFEDAQKQLVVETALGSTTILKQLYGLDHVQDCTPVIGLDGIKNEAIRRKFEDAIITSTALYQDGLRPFGQHNRNRILKQYVRSLSYFRAKSGISIDGLTQIISAFEQREFLNPQEQNAEVIAEFVRAFENDVFARKDLTEDEKKIKKSLKLLV